MNTLDRAILKQAAFSGPSGFLAFGFGSGLAPVAPGTAGSLVGLAFMPFLYVLPLWWLVSVILLAFFYGIYICRVTTEQLGVHDHGGIVWDEIVGIQLLLLALPVNWKTLLLAFLLFRVFDILKPWPISWLDSKVKGGLGIMLDDVLAGLFGLGLMHLLFYFFPGWLM